MRTMTCKQLGGACDLEFHAETFEEIGELSRHHGMEMGAQAEEAHLKAMEEMRRLMASPEAMNKWMEERRSEFDKLPDLN